MWLISKCLGDWGTRESEGCARWWWRVSLERGLMEGVGGRKRTMDDPGELGIWIWGKGWTFRRRTGKNCLEENKRGVEVSLDAGQTNKLYRRKARVSISVVELALVELECSHYDWWYMWAVHGVDIRKMQLSVILSCLERRPHALHDVKCKFFLPVLTDMHYDGAIASTKFPYVHSMWASTQTTVEASTTRSQKALCLPTSRSKWWYISGVYLPFQCEPDSLFLSTFDIPTQNLRNPRAPGQREGKLWARFFLNRPPFFCSGGGGGDKGGVNSNQLRFSILMRFWGGSESGTAGEEACSSISSSKNGIDLGVKGIVDVLAVLHDTRHGAAAVFSPSSCSCILPPVLTYERIRLGGDTGRSSCLPRRTMDTEKHERFRVRHRPQHEPGSVPTPRGKP